MSNFFRSSSLAVVMTGAFAGCLGAGPSVPSSENPRADNEPGPGGLEQPNGEIIGGIEILPRLENDLYVQGVLDNGVRQAFVLDEDGLLMSYELAAGDHAMAIVDGTQRVLGCNARGNSYDLKGALLEAEAFPGLGQESDPFKASCATDAATDGFAASFAIAPTNDGRTLVLGYNLSWGEPRLLFALVGAYTGIAYDTESQSLWLSGEVDGAHQLENRTVGGDLVKAMATGIASPSSFLAYDAASATLWTGSRDVADDRMSLVQIGTQTGNVRRFATDLPALAQMSAEFEMTID